MRHAYHFKGYCIALMHVILWSLRPLMSTRVYNRIMFCLLQTSKRYIIPVCKSKYIVYGAMILSGQRFIRIAIKELFVCRFYHIKKIGNIKVVLLLCCAIYIAMKCVWMYYRLQTAPEPNKVPYEFISIWYTVYIIYMNSSIAPGVYIIIYTI